MTKDTEPQAFPSNQNCVGMTLHDYFAAKAMQGLLAGGATSEQVLKYSYKYADEMLKAREA